ncbi:hypothetical protein ACWCZB_17700, partial [Streptomyces sp. NPDC001500]
GRGHPARRRGAARRLPSRTGDAADRLGPPFPRAAEPDPGWPGAGSAAPWGISDADGDADWPDEEITSGGDGDGARENWEKHA